MEARANVAVSLVMNFFSQYWARCSIVLPTADARNTRSWRWSTSNYGNHQRIACRPVSGQRRCDYSQRESCGHYRLLCRISLNSTFAIVQPLSLLVCGCFGISRVSQSPVMMKLAPSSDLASTLLTSDALINRIGAGWTYVMCSGVVVVFTPLVWLVVNRGPKWRKQRMDGLQKQANDKAEKQAQKQKSETKPKS